ncbi:hypothetical protein Tco_0623979 [Tanacetum coccineum]|uniref:Uncharacterized protein n=1 Tax=Tanacetum coccineum TaxID=301880 RepID=A0ABQ4WCP3_9ASTR
MNTDQLLEELLKTLKPNPRVKVEEPEGSDDYTEVSFDDEKILRHHYTTHVTPLPLAYTPLPPCLTTMEPLDAFSMGNEVISILPAREIDEFIKSSVDDLVLILRESEVTLVSVDLECSMPIDSQHLPCIVVLGDEEIDLLLRDDVDTLSTGDREIDFDPSRDIEEKCGFLLNFKILQKTKNDRARYELDAKRGVVGSL